MTKQKNKLMKKLLSFFLLVLVIGTTSIINGQSKQGLHVEPPFWWKGMEYNTLEILLYGENLAQYDAVLKGDNIELKETIKPENPNYLFLEVEIAADVDNDFIIELQNKKGKTKLSYTYELKDRREGSKDRIGFSSSDVIYLLMPDRFANGDPTNDSKPEMKEKADRSVSLGRHGGDLQGIIKNLDYIHDLGYTALWLNPVLENNMPHESYHGYAITDFYKVDARLGTNDDYVKLIELMHQKGMKMVKDMVFNHAGTEGWIIEDLPMKDWVNQWDEFTRSNFRGMTISDPYASEFDQYKMSHGWFDVTMADLNQKNPHVLKYLIQNSIWWIEYSNLDGIRMDTYPYPDKDAMAEWAKVIKKEYPNFSIVAESWLHMPLHTAYWQEGSNTSDGYNSYVKSVTDFPVHYALNAALNENEGWLEGLNRLYYVLSHDGLYNKPNDMLVFVDNHDVERFTRVVDGDINKFKNGIAFYLTTRGAVQVYYGTEIMMDSKPYQDHGSWRRDYPGGWEGDEINAFSGVGLTEKQVEAREYMKLLLNWRKEKDVIHKGKLKHFIPENKTYVYARYNENESVVVIINKNDEDVAMDMTRYQEILKGYSTATDVISGKKFDNLQKLELKANTPLILELN